MLPRGGLHAYTCVHRPAFTREFLAPDAPTAHGSGGATGSAEHHAGRCGLRHPGAVGGRPSRAADQNPFPPDLGADVVVTPDVGEFLGLTVPPLDPHAARPSPSPTQQTIALTVGAGTLLGKERLMFVQFQLASARTVCTNKAEGGIAAQALGAPVRRWRFTSRRLPSRKSVPAPLLPADAQEHQPRSHQRRNQRRLQA